MPSVSDPFWFLVPLLAFAWLAFGRRHATLPGAWHRAIANDLQSFLAGTVQQTRDVWRAIVLLCLWLAICTALATIRFGQVETPKLRNLDARVVVIDLGVPNLSKDRITAARYLIDSADDVPTAVVAVTKHAFDVVPLTRDATHLDRYLQVLTNDVMPIEGRSLLTGIERASLLLNRAGIQARQITVFTGGEPPTIERFGKPDQAQENNIWLVVPEDAAAPWQDFANELGARLIDDLQTSLVHVDFEDRRRNAAAEATSIRERQDITPWLIAIAMPLWLLSFFRRRSE